MSKILVVDDSPANRDLIVSLIRHRGHEALEASDGAEALRLVRDERPILVISDILMPTMDGYEFVRELRADPALAHTEVIFYTAFYREREARKLAEACGVKRILTKPAEPEQILEVIDDALAGEVQVESQVESQPLTGEFDRDHLRLVTDKLSEKVSELQASNQRLAALTDLNLRFASERDPKALLENVCRGARHLIGSKRAILVARDNEGVSFLTAGFDATTAATLETPRIDAGIFAGVLTERRSQRVTSADGAHVRVGLPSNHPPARSLLVAPVASLEVVYGWVCLLDRVGDGPFTDEDEELLTILGAQVGRIFENGRLYVQVRKHVDEIRESEERFRQLAENIREVFSLIEPTTGRTLYVSPAFEEIWGRSCETVYQRPEAWFDAIHPEDASRAQAAMGATNGEAAEFDQEYRIVRPDGTVRWIRSRGFPILNGEGVVYRIAGIADDITSRRQAEVRIQRLNRVHAVLSSINGLIVRVRERQELFDEACRIAVDQGQFKLAWIGLADSARQEVVPAACAGDAVSFLARVRIPLTGAREEDLSLAARALRRAEPMTCNDIALDNRSILYREEMLSRGYRSLAVLPLIVDDKSIGCLALYAGEKDVFDDEEMRLLIELAGDISFALDHINKSERLDYVAYYDALTGLANRTLFLERLSQQVAAAERSGRKLAVIVTDVERLKAVNDSLGRHAGDQLLKMLGERFAASAGIGPDVARVGSDEFAAIVPDVIGESEVVRTIEHWEQHVFAESFTIDHAELRITAKTGISVFPDDARQADTLFHNAEAALERAKGTEHKYRFYTQEMTERIAGRLRLETRLQAALERQEFYLHYQPKVSMETRQILGVEALIRWQNPDLGLVMPLEFIPILEDTGMILGVGAWALRQAVIDFAKWQTATDRAPRIAVNVSAVQLRSPRFVDDLREILESALVRPRIDLEITESRFMDDVLDNIATLEQIRDLGVNVAIDDFGTEYSSLAYLARLPVHALKIDRAFIRLMLDDPDTMTLVSTIISLAHSLRLEVIAEGVESEDQARILRLLRCDQMQGYLIGRPVPFEDLTALLTTGGF
jgi:diguanylate cyclase (GGDEF)-like protein/PAS domain S-box-containing protein